MGVRRSHRFPLVWVFLALLLSGFAFGLHARNWHRWGNGRLEVVSGLYWTRIEAHGIDSIAFPVDLPKMERRSGFSWADREKGRFSGTVLDRDAWVFVDRLGGPVLRIVHSDSIEVYLNLRDSSETRALYDEIQMWRELGGPLPTEGPNLE